MSAAPSKNLLFFHAQKKSNETNDILTLQANKIIQQCREKLVIVTDDDIKKKLNAIIEDTTALLAASLHNKPAEAILSHSHKLQTDALLLPTQLQQQSRLSNMGKGIAKASVFILALSVSIAVGSAFYAMYLSVLTAKMVVDALALTLSTIGIPAATLGLFAYGLQRADKQKKQSDEVSDLQNDIDAFCETATKGHKPSQDDDVVVHQSQGLRQVV